MSGRSSSVGGVGVHSEAGAYAASFFNPAAGGFSALFTGNVRANDNVEVRNGSEIRVCNGERVIVRIDDSYNGDGCVITEELQINGGFKARLHNNDYHYQCRRDLDPR